MDKVSGEKRSWIMAQVKGRNTKPELMVRSLLHRLGYRFRLHRSSLPGNPDIVLPRYKAVVFVHGCFWHRHMGCKRASIPTSNVLYWSNKFDRTVKRDEENKGTLESLGWNVITVWECEIKDLSALESRLNTLLLKK